MIEAPKVNVWINHYEKIPSFTRLKILTYYPLSQFRINV